MAPLTAGGGKRRGATDNSLAKADTSASTCQPAVQLLIAAVLERDNLAARLHSLMHACSVLAERLSEGKADLLRRPGSGKQRRRPNKRQSLAAASI